MQETVLSSKPHITMGALLAIIKRFWYILKDGRSCALPINNTKKCKAGKLVKKLVVLPLIETSGDFQTMFRNYLVTLFFRKHCLVYMVTGLFITKTSPCNEDLLTPHFYIVTIGVYRGIHYFLLFALKHRVWVLVRTASLRVPTIYVLEQK